MFAWGLSVGLCERMSVGLCVRIVCDVRMSVGLCVRMSVGFVRLDVITKKVSVL